MFGKAELIAQNRQQELGNKQAEKGYKVSTC